jgi:hypothetical protein
MSGAQAGVDALSVSTAIHPADAFIADGQPLFPAHMRDLPRAIILDASFAIALDGRITDGREAHAKSVAGCEGAACVISTDSSPYAGNG